MGWVRVLLAVVGVLVLATRGYALALLLRGSPRGYWTVPEKALWITLLVPYFVFGLSCILVAIEPAAKPLLLVAAVVFVIGWITRRGVLRRIDEASAD